MTEPSDIDWPARLRTVLTQCEESKNLLVPVLETFAATVTEGAPGVTASVRLGGDEETYLYEVVLAGGDAPPIVITSYSPRPHGFEGTRGTLGTTADLWKDLLWVAESWPFKNACAFHKARLAP